jgi:hypothetical protein
VGFLILCREFRGGFLVEFLVVEFGKWLLKKFKFVGSNPRIICVFSILWFIYFLISYFPFFITKMWFLKIPIFLSKIPQLFMKKKNILISDSQTNETIFQASFFSYQSIEYHANGKTMNKNKCLEFFIFLVCGNVWMKIVGWMNFTSVESRVWFSMLLGMKFLEWLGSNPAENCSRDIKLICF